MSYFILLQQLSHIARYLITCKTLTTFDAAETALKIMLFSLEKED